MIRIMCGRWCWTRRLLSTRRLLGGKAAVPGKGKGESGVGPCCCYPRVCMRGECLQGGGGGGGGSRWRVARNLFYLAQIKFEVPLPLLGYSQAGC